MAWTLHDLTCRMTWCAMEGCTAIVCLDHDDHEELPDGQVSCLDLRHGWDEE